jgi:hypothetical protein
VLEELLRRQDPRAIGRLAKASRDRDGLVVFTAVSALRRWGTADDVPRLDAVARARKTPPGTREAAYDAIESICARAGIAPPKGAPAARLVEVPLPPGSTVTVSLAQLVAAGAAIASARGKVVVRAPCDAVVVASEPDGIVLRKYVR